MNYLTFNKEIQDDLESEAQVSKEPTSDSTDDIIIDFIDDDIINVQNSMEVILIILTTSKFKMTSNLKFKLRRKC